MKLRTVLIWVVFAAVVFAMAWLLKPTSASVYREVGVPVEVIREVERVDTVVTWRERIVYREAEPVTVATADGGGVSDLTAFCGPSVAAATDSVRRELEAAPVLLLRSVRTEPGWFFSSDRIIATGPRSDGSLWQGTYDARPGWRAHVRGPELLVQSPRWWWVREGIEVLLPAAIGYGVGRTF